MKEYGLKLTDELGATYIRWFNTDGAFNAFNGISVLLLQIGSELDEISLKRAIRYSKTMKNGICYTVLYEDDFKKQL